MSRTNDLLRAMFALLFLLLVVPAHAGGYRVTTSGSSDEDHYEQKFSKDLRVGSGGGRVTIDHRFGDLNVRTQSGNTVSVRATIRSSDPDIGKEIRIVATEEAGGVSVKTIFPEVHIRHGHISYSVDMTVTIPANSPLTAKNQFGETDVRGLRASSIIDNRQGSITFADARGTSHSISNAFGGIDVDDVESDLTVNNNNGSITVNNVRGRLAITNRFGSVTVDDAKRDVTIGNANGSVTALDIGGTLKVTNAFGNVKAASVNGTADITTTNAKVDLANIQGSAIVRNSFGSVVAQSVKGSFTADCQNSKVDAAHIDGNVKVDTAFGGVTLQNIGGLVDVTTSNGNITVMDAGAFTAETRFGSVRAERIRGGADIKGSNGGITLQEINGDVKVRTSFGAAFISGPTGSVDVQNENGAISVERLRSSGCKPIALRTSFSSIRITLPENAGYSVNARTSFGHIRSAIPVNTTSAGDDSLIGTIGRGGCRLDLATSNGSITIERE
jgi:hypothetical protein